MSTNDQRHDDQTGKPKPTSSPEQETIVTNQGTEPAGPTQVTAPPRGQPGAPASAAPFKTTELTIPSQDAIPTVRQGPAGGPGPGQTLVTRVIGDAQDAQSTQPKPGYVRRPSEHLTMATDLHIEAGGKMPAKVASGTHQHQVWGDFELGDMLGRGGMGAVYRGRQISLDRQVAVKVLPAHLSEDESFRKRFLLEARAVAQINSPNVIQVFFAGIHEGHHYFAMEYIEGTDLAKKLKDGYRPTYHEALDLVTQAACGLVAAGEHNIVHRDIKPGNMMLTTKGVLKLMDFGLVRLARSDETGITMTGTIMGTVSYFSPEQGRGERCDQRTDIYALGVVFYELLTGKLPFTGGDATSVIYQHIHVAPTPPKEIDPAIPEDYQAVVLKCMQKNVAHRYQSAAELVADLKALQSGLSPITAFLDPSALRLGGTIVKKEEFSREKARTAAWWWTAAALIALVAGGGLWYWRPWAAKPQPAPPPRVVVKPPPQPAPQTPAPPGLETPVITPTPPGPETLIAPPPADAPAIAADTPPLERARLFLQAGSWDECRKLVEISRQLHPDDQEWTSLAGDLEQGQGLAELTEAQAAFSRGDYETAGKKANAAQVHLPQSQALQDFLQKLTEHEGVLKQRQWKLAEAENLMNEGNPVKAEELLTALQKDAPDDKAVDGVLRHAKKLRQDKETNERAANEQLDLGKQALARKDFDGALVAYTAAKQHDPNSAKASAGLEAVTKIKKELADINQRFEQALLERSLVEAEKRLAEIKALAPGSATQVLAEGALANSRLAEEAKQKEAMAREAQVTGQAKAILQRLDDLSVELPPLEQQVKEFLEKAASDRPERIVLEIKLEDRRQRLRVGETLANLDAAMRRLDPAAVKTVVADPDYAKALAALMAYPGLVFEQRLESFARRERQATAKVIIRHALQVFPERQLTFLYDLRQDDQGWKIHAAQLQP
jgi:thiamine kinase-like enzyme